MLGVDSVLFGRGEPGGGVRLSFPGGNAAAPTPADPERFRSFHYQGGVASAWREAQPTFRAIRYADLYDGVDLSFTAAGGHLKYELVAAPGADLDAVTFAYASSAGLSLESPTVLRIQGGDFEVRDSIGASYDAEGRAVHCTFVLRSASAVGFSCPEWLGTALLTVDPVLYGTYIGGNGQDDVGAAAVDGTGNYYLAGRTTSSDFPTTAGAYDRTWAGYDDFYVMKFSSTNQLIWATYVGGTYNDFVTDLVVGPDGGPYVAGYTSSGDFPNTTGAFDNTTVSLDDEGFVLHLSAGGALVFSTFLGGSAQDGVTAIAVNGAGEVYAAGGTRSSDFPTTNGSYQQNLSAPFQYDGFVTKLSSDGTAAVYSTLIGGALYDSAMGIVVDANGSATVVGGTASTDYPTTPGAYSRTLNPSGGGDGVVTRLTPDGSQLIFSTFMGGAPGETLDKVLLDGTGNIFFLGSTVGPGSPNTSGAYQTTYGGGSLDGWVGALSPNGSALLFGTYLGGSGGDVPRAFGADPAGNLYIGFYTNSPALPTTALALSPTYGGNNDGYLVKLNKSGDRLLSATYFGSSGGESIQTLVVREPDRVLIGGYTSAPGIPATLDAFDGSLTGFNDGYAADLDLRIFNLSVRTAVPGLSFRVDATSHTDRYDFLCPAGSTYRLNATSPQVNASTRYEFTNWSDGGAPDHNVTCSGDLVVVAAFSRQFSARIVSDPAALGLEADGAGFAGFAQYWWDENSTHSVSALSPQPTTDGNVSTRQVFFNWSDGGAITHTVVANGPLSLTAHFGLEFLVNVRTDPPGLALAVDAAIGSPSYWWAANSTHTIEVRPSEQPQPEVRYIFESWSDRGAASHSVTADGAKALVALFRTEYQVVLDTDPPELTLLVDGAATSAPAALWWVQGSSHRIGVNATQTAGGTRYLFAQWSDGGAMVHNVTAAANLSVRALLATEFLVEILSDPPGLSALFDGSIRPTPYSVWLPNGSAHTLAVATPPSSSGFERWVFQNWSDGGLPNHTIVAGGPLSVAARFAHEYRVTGDTLYGEIACDRPDCWYPAGSTATINVSSPVAGANGTRYAFLRWEGSVGGSASILSIVMTGPQSVTARWTTEYLLTVVSEYGNVTGAGWYASGAAAAIALAPTEAVVGDQHYRFAGWSGATASQGANTSVSMIAPRTVTARWELVPEAPNAPFPILILLVAGAAGAAVALFVWRRRAARATAAERPPLEKGPDERGAGGRQAAAPGAPTILAVGAAASSQVPPVSATFPCPTCSAAVAAGAARCEKCGLALEW